VPRGPAPQAVTLDQAVALLAERAAKGGGKKPARAAKAPRKVATATAPAKKKPAKKRAAAKETA
jgi:DNA topoisomerase-1